MITYFLQVFGKYYKTYKGHFHSIHELYQYLRDIEPDLQYVDERDVKAYLRMTKKDKKILFENSYHITICDHKKNKLIYKLYRQPCSKN